MGRWTMEAYLNTGGNSGIMAYELGPDFVRVQFRDGTAYLYTKASAGADNIECMKRLARQGQGLNAFINRVVRKKYARRER